MDRPELQEWVTRHPTDGVARVYLGVLLGRSGQSEEGLHQLRTGLKQKPDLHAARVRLARVLEARGDIEEAMSALQQGVHRGAPPPELAVELGRLYIATGQSNRAEPLLTDLVRSHPTHAEAWYRLGQARLSSNRPAEALDALNRAADLAPRTVEYLSAVGEALRSRLRLPEAERRFRSALALRPTHFEALYGLALTQRDQGVDGAAVQAAFQAAVAASPENPLAHFALAGVCRDAGNLEGAERGYRAALERVERREPPESLGWRAREEWLGAVEAPCYQLAAVLRRRGRPADAAVFEARFKKLSSYRNEVRRLLARSAYRPTDGELNLRLGRLHAANGALVLAEMEIRTAIRRSDPPGALQALHRILKQRQGSKTP